MTISIFRPSRLKNGKRIKARIYRLCYRMPWMTKQKFVSLKTSDRQVAEKKAREFLAELEQERGGLIAPKTVRISADKSLELHLDNFASDLRAQGRDRMYVYNVEKRLAKLCKECGWRVIADMSADTFQAWRAKQDKAAKTLKDYQDAAMGFVKWLMANGRCTANPLATVAKVQTRGKQVRRRRALTFDELNRLLAGSGERRVGYLAAFFTGLRRAELKALQWGDVHFDAELPFIAVRASTTKNASPAPIRLHPQLASALMKLRPTDASAADPVFRRENVASMWMMRKDLEAAGIPFVDAQGRRVDFHSLRGTLNTHLAGKDDPQVRQKIMRHSDIKLTLDTYTDSTLLKVSEAIMTLPRFSEDAGLCAGILDICSPDAAQGGTNAAPMHATKVIENQSIGHEMAQTDATCHLEEKRCLTRIRT